MSEQLTVVHPQAGGQSAIDVERDRNYIQTLIASKNLPRHITSFESAFLIARMGADLGFTITQSFQYIVNVQGTITLNAKGLGILLKREGYRLKTTHDGWYILEDGSRVEYVNRVVGADGIPRDSITGKALMDQFTTIKYTKRYGPNDIEEGEVTYYFSEAIAADLVAKDTWKKYRKAMMHNRAKTRLASYVGLLLLPETEEIAMLPENRDVVELDVDADGDVIIKE